MTRFISAILTLISFITEGQLLPTFTVTVCEPQSTGYYFCGLLKVDEPLSGFNQYHLILDCKGEIVYSKGFSQGALTCDFKLQSNGMISYFFNDKFYLMDSTFTIVDSVGAKNGLITDSHEFLLLPNGNCVLLGKEDIRPHLARSYYNNSSNMPAIINATIQCGVVQELDKNKNVVFEWRSKNYFDFNDIDSTKLKDSVLLDWMHFNAIEPDNDGNYLISIRYFNEITKISRKDSSILWRLGGKHNEFTFVNDNVKFIGQHDMRRLKNGNLSLFDNGWKDSTFHDATAKEYELNEISKEIKLVWSYLDKLVISSAYSGSVQRLTNGNTLVNYGTSNGSTTLFNVVDKKGSKIFEIIFKNTFGSYRAFNYNKLPGNYFNQPFKKSTKKVIFGSMLEKALQLTDGQQEKKLS